MSDSKPVPSNSVESIQAIWQRQRDEMEREFFGGWQPTLTAPPQLPLPDGVQLPPPQPVARNQAATNNAVAANNASKANADAAAMKDVQSEVESARAKHAAWLKQSNEAALKERLELQKKFETELAQQRDTAEKELSRQRSVVEIELAAREKSWNQQRDKEWASLQHAKAIHEQSVKRLRDELASQRVQEREQLLAWKQQIEHEASEARQTYERERLNQQQELARQIETERERLRRERADLTRQAEAERERLRHERAEQIHQIDAEREMLRHERAELERLRDVLREKFRREQLVLQSSMQFFEQNLTRVSDELRTGTPAERAATGADGGPVLPMPAAEQVIRAASPAQANTLTLDQIRERLYQMRQPDVKKAA